MIFLRGSKITKRSDRKGAQAKCAKPVPEYWRVRVGMCMRMRLCLCLVFLCQNLPKFFHHETANEHV